MRHGTSPQILYRNDSIASIYIILSKRYICQGVDVLVRYLEIMPVTLSPCAALRVNSAKGLARWAQRSFASLRMTARTPLQSASGSLISKHLRTGIGRKYLHRKAITQYRLWLKCGRGYVSQPRK